jgi:poly(3-hydroxybutyrate) depolymerase
VQNRYVNDEWHYQSRALGALLPEVDQFMLGFRIIPALDPLFTLQQARVLSKDTQVIYAELEADRDFHALGSVMPDAYDDLWGLSSRRGHYFLYVPPALDRTKPAPALVFLHGSGGNFKSYTWLLSKIADELGMVLIAPSDGMGDWDAKRSPQTVANALDDAAKIIRLDAGRMHLAGLSNGGMGVSRVAGSVVGKRFCSLVFLSPVCDQGVLGSSAFSDNWKSLPILVITGTADDRVPLEYVNKSAAMMKRSGATVEQSVYSDANHFLFFSHRERCLKEMSSWLSKTHPRG